MEPVTPSKRKGAPAAEEPVRDATAGEDDVLPGQRLGEFVIEGPLGRGGMGEVFTAVHPKIGKRAAVKVLKKELSNPFNVERFIDEARVVNAIGHPNIVDIFAFGDMPDGRCYFIMELLVGQTLRERIASGPMPVDEVCTILKPLIRALDAAHAKGITHRDLKPDNIFLVEVSGEKPIVKLLDFGIAKLANNDHRVEQTKSGVMVGTPQYIAPEQAKGHAVDARADVYALGGIAFEMLTGRPPFVADNAMEMVAKHLMEQPVNPSTVVAGIPADLDVMVVAMLAKEPAQRPFLDDVAVVIERLRQAPIQPEDALTSSYTIDVLETPRIQDLSLVTQEPRGARLVAAPMLSASEVYMIEPRSGPHTSVDVAVTDTSNTEREAIAPSRGRWAALSVILLGAAMLLSFVLISSLKSSKTEVDATVVAVAADAGLVAIPVDAAPLVVDAAPVVHDATVAPVDARVVVQPPPPPRRGKLVIDVAPAKGITISINGVVVSRGRHLEYTTTLGQTYTVDIRANGREPKRLVVTPRSPVLTKSVRLELDLMAPANR